MQPLQFPDSRDPDFDARMAEGFGLDELPDPSEKYGDMPIRSNAKEISALVSHKKACTIVDAIATFAFSKYIPPQIIISQDMDARSFVYGSTFLAHCPSVGDIPVNEKITAATGVGLENTFENRSIWLAQTILWEYQHFGARKMSPPLVFLARGPGGEGSPGSTQGVIFMLDRTPPDGLTALDMVASIGILLDHGTESDNLVMPIGELPETDE